MTDDAMTSGPPAAARGDRTAALEVAAVVLLILVQVWRPWWLWGYRLPWGLDELLLPGLAGAIVVVSFVRLRETWRDLGFDPVAWRSGWGSAALFTGAGVAGVVAMGLAWGRPSLGRREWVWLANYAPLLVFQQIALQCFLNNRLYYAAGGDDRPRAPWIAVAAGTVLFVLLHAPNYVLMGGVAWAGAFWLWHFRRHRNLPALALSHLMLGAAAMIFMGYGPMMRLRVGLPALDLMRNFTLIPEVGG